MSGTEAGRVEWHDSECEQWEGTAIDGVTPLTIACSCGLPELIASREAEARYRALAEVRERVEGLRGYEDSIGRFSLDPLGHVVHLYDVMALLDEAARARDLRQCQEPDCSARPHWLTVQSHTFDGRADAPRRPRGGPE